MSEISFYEQFEWSAARAAMKFWAVVDGDPLQCWIDEESLSTFSDEGDESEKNVQTHFIENQERIHEIARQMILNKQFDDDNSVSITPAALTATSDSSEG